MVQQTLPVPPWQQPERPVLGSRIVHRQPQDTHWQAYLRNGITSVVSVADEMDLVLAARAAEQDGDLRASRVFAAGPALTAPGGHPVATILRGELRRFRNMAVEIGDPADARRAVRRLVQGDGVDLIKVVYSTIPGNVPRPGSDILDAVIDEAHLLGRRIFPHGLRRRRPWTASPPA